VTLSEEGPCSIVDSDAGDGLVPRSPTGLAFRANLDEVPSFPDEVSFHMGGTSPASEGRV
jgi:hypothetical protein